jgi:ATP-dependent Clp protease ATP-binding subunit ClpA
VRAAERFFRPEFFNRLDRVVPFERLGRDEVAMIARGLIRGVLGREGLVRRKLCCTSSRRRWIASSSWAMTAASAALKRAIEKHLTCPVAHRLAAGCRKP